jgi:hypothetical protein
MSENYFCINKIGGNLIVTTIDQKYWQGQFSDSGLQRELRTNAASDLFPDLKTKEQIIENMESQGFLYSVEVEEFLKKHLEP